MLRMPFPLHNGLQFGDCQHNKIISQLGQLLWEVVMGGEEHTAACPSRVGGGSPLPEEHPGGMMPCQVFSFCRTCALVLKLAKLQHAGPLLEHLLLQRDFCPSAKHIGYLFGCYAVWSWGLCVFSLFPLCVAKVASLHKKLNAMQGGS